ncbi:sensor domain-containing diguanylate cyclase [Maledivibacter halophilus]|uniref:Diguanylate cyclase (GGDEF) domain-containing protein n=1 Tax=Maledivibacter halophilus TaxID=36842 RepID=A0A1T5JWZ6_9FIRM|nr:sensor domain-containing diguanylate cyclase [Maledivibacter halophilus]SKC55935.1 diguanylate cyclase (GGDEF) domain-containing protein [Maledivibacter halophilus]
MKIRKSIKQNYILFKVVTFVLLIIANINNYHRWSYMKIIPLTLFIVIFNILFSLKNKNLKIKVLGNFFLIPILLWYLNGVNNISYHVFFPFIILTATIYISRSYGIVLFALSNIFYISFSANNLNFMDKYLFFLYITLAAVLFGRFVMLHNMKSEELDKKVKEFEALYKISKLIDSFPDNQVVLEGIAEIVAKTLCIDDCLIMLYDKDRDILSTKAHYGSIYVNPRDIIFSMGEGAAGKVLKTLDSIVSSDLISDYNIKETFKYDFPIQACAIIPLIFNKKGIGVIAVCSKEKYKFCENTVELLYMIASRICSVLENSNLYNRMKINSFTDGLTKLYNYRCFYKTLKEKVENVNELNNNLFLLLIDIDKFKKFNDIYGHIVGDKVLITISKIIKDNIRESDIAFRYGGEEFAIIIPNSDLTSACKIAERIKEKIKGAKNYIDELKAEDVKITVSIGISSYPYCAKGIMNLIKEADIRMYWGKKNGGDTVVYMENTEVV